MSMGSGECGIHDAYIAGAANGGGNVQEVIAALNNKSTASGSDSGSGDSSD